MKRTDACYDTDWEFYDSFYEDVDDLGFYTDLARRTGGPVLEAMCGTGRLLVPLARAGFEVTGLDSNTMMLAQARKKLEGVKAIAGHRVTLVEGDIRNFDLKKKYRLNILAFSSINHLLTPEDQDRALACIRHHISEEGLLAVASFYPHDDQPRTEMLDKEVELENGDLLIRYSTLSRDDNEGLLHIAYKWELEREGRIVREHDSELHLRLLRPKQLGALLENAGFEVLERFGGYRGEPLSSKGDIIVMVARKTSDESLPKSIFSERG